jgi:AP-2 complex subunit beta-1
MATHTPQHMDVPLSESEHSVDSADEGPQGKVAELRQELGGGGKKDKNHVAKKNALKKIVANMTMSNNDMVMLFPDIIQCMEIPNLDIKKMYVSRLLRRTTSD